jgi:hypothetical protein
MAVDIKTREFHDVVYIWPKMQSQEFAELVADIRANGLREPIWTYQGKIIDGRHRKLGCDEAGVEPRYQEWNGEGSLILFVASLNQHRRHLDAGQRAMIAVEIEKGLAKEAQDRVGGRPIKPIEDNSINNQKPVSILTQVSGRSADQAAKITGTSGGYVRDAKKITEQAPELKPLVMDRSISLPEAKRLAKKPEDERNTLVSKVVSGEAKTVKEAELQVIKENINAQAQVAPTKPNVTLASWETWLPEQEPCDLLITDPPFSTDIADIEAFANAWLPIALSKVKPTGRAYVCIGAYPHELKAYLNVKGCLPVAQVLVWSYRNTLGPSPTHDYKQNWQAVLYFRGSDAPPLNSDIMTMNEQFSVREINAPDGRQGNHYHAWQKPDLLAEQLIRHSTKPGDRIIDCFTGTGTFLLIAHNLGRVASGCEQSPEMIEIARTRGCEVLNG